MKNITISILFFCLAVLPQIVYAAGDPCEKDSAKYCALNRPDDPVRLYCLKSVESQISSSCKAYLKNIKGSTEDFISECSTDYHKLCAQTRPGQGRILECLRDHSKELEFECRKMVNMMPRHNPKEG